MLRKDAIRCLLQLHSNPSIDAKRLEEEVDKAFQLWMDARTESINENYADNVLSTLSQIRSSIIPSSKFGKLYIGAITDGNSDPMSVPSIREYFDFVIRAEDVGVSKPDGKVYKAAVGELLVNLMRDGFNIETFFLGESSHDAVGYGPAAYIGPSAKSWRDVEEETIETFSEAVGPWWIHVGDDFFKDIVASKSFGMRSIWVRELIAKNQSIITAKETSIQQKVERTVQDLENEKEDGVLKMAIGESKFLASTLHDEFSDAILEKFEQLENLLIGWHEEGLKEQAELDSTFESQVPEAIDTLQGVEVVHPSRSVPVSASQTEDNKKFCVFCGALLPPVAKFCSSCGEKQP
jgi:FMN phosphatase YigB (HAD superfamily)/ribosomal protein L40E